MTYSVFMEVFYQHRHTDQQAIKSSHGRQKAILVKGIAGDKKYH